MVGRCPGANPVFFIHIPVMSVRQFKPVLIVRHQNENFRVEQSAVINNFFYIFTRILMSEIEYFSIFGTSEYSSTLYKHWFDVTYRYCSINKQLARSADIHR